ncbi:hypothetical protein BDDG_00095 [Blastomyces dermatitidis ATCC 18188]|uniref:DUF7924 domain-containing protein n=1 Tax=Ajellomyces dermatitidis (strain ATCC 18188 / CBS 674.68) TaxID=653446 RepID=F2T2P8_AJEDA|nr:hypothetical protein BDDG_00095 [Blastomyces dermatitidis ATCC 18188]
MVHSSKLTGYLLVLSMRAPVAPWRGKPRRAGGLCSQLDYAARFSCSVLMEDWLKKFELFLDYDSDIYSLFFLATFYMYFPFLISEVKDTTALDITDQQNTHSMPLLAYHNLFINFINHGFTSASVIFRRAFWKCFLKNLAAEYKQIWGKIYISNTPHDLAKLLDSLQNHVVMNMEQQACEEAKAGLAVYYKVRA